MGFSRVDKLIREVAALDSLVAARAVRDRPINLLLGAPTARDPKVAWMALTAVGLALRSLTGPIRVCIPHDVPPGPPRADKSLMDLIEAEALRHESAGRLSFTRSLPDTGATLGLGVDVPQGFTADASGWVAGINQVLPPSRNTVAPAAVFATCCAFAKLFKSQVLAKAQATDESWVFDLDSLGVPAGGPGHGYTLDNLGHIGLLGAGAIGAGFAFTLWLSGWSAQLDIIDRDRYDQPNIETTMLVGQAEVRARGRKADVLAGLLRTRSGISVNPIHADIVAGSPQLHEQRDVFVCAVDNPETRRILDDTRASVLLNGAVGGTRDDSGHVLFSRHLMTDAPLAHLYPDVQARSRSSLQTPLDISDECSRMVYEGISMAVPFLGLASGALLLAGCAHHAAGIELQHNYLKVDLLGRQSRYLRDRRTRIKASN